MSKRPKKKYLEGMNNFKNGIIALLTGLLVLTLSTQNSNGATKTYDAVKLAQYSTCLWSYGQNESSGVAWAIERCSQYKP